MPKKSPRDDEKRDADKNNICTLQLPLEKLPPVAKGYENKTALTGVVNIGEQRFSQRKKRCTFSVQTLHKKAVDYLGFP